MNRVRWNRVPQNIESAILALAKAHPTLGRVRAAAELNSRGLNVGQSTVRTVWKRHGLQTSEKRQAAIARAPAPHSQALVLTEEAQPPRHLAWGQMSESFTFSLAALVALGVDE